MSGSSLLKKNLRHFARVNAHFTAYLSTAKGNIRHAEIENISRAGVMLSCDRETLETILPNNQSPAPWDALQIDLAFEIPVDAYHTETVQSQCKVVYVRRLARDKFQIGLGFGKLSVDGANLVACYLKNQKGEG